MKRSILYSVAVAVAVLVGLSHEALAKTASEICNIALTSKLLITDPNKLAAYVGNPNSYNSGSASNVDDNGRYVLCWNNLSTAAVPLKLVAGTLPVNIYNLSTDSNSSLTATGNILFQNLSAPGIKSVITFYDGASMVGGNITCDKSYVQAALDIFGTGKSTIDSSNITGCKRGIRVNSDNNILSALTIDSSAAQQSDLVPNAPAIRLEGQNNTIRDSKMLVQGFDVGVNVFNSTAAAPAIIQNVHIENPAGVVGTAGLNLNSPAKLTGSTITGYHVAVSVPQAAPEGAAITLKLNTLGGDVAAVQIEKGITGVKVSQNTFSGKTIAYVDPEDIKSNTLLSVEWMGKEVSKDDPNIVTRVTGKILFPDNQSSQVEFVKSKDKSFFYVKTCQVSTLGEDASLVFEVKDAYGNKTENKMLPGEKYFDCDLTTDGNQPLKVELMDRLKFYSNTPTISLMSDDIELSQMRDKPTVLSANPSSQIGGSDLTGDVQMVNLGNADAPALDAPGGHDAGGGTAKLPSDIPGPSDTDGSSNMTGNAVTLSGEAPAGVSGGADAAGATGFFASAASGKTGCSLIEDLQTPGAASALMWVLLLLPIPILIPMRSRRK